MSMQTQADALFRQKQNTWANEHLSQMDKTIPLIPTEFTSISFYASVIKAVWIKYM